MNGVTPPSSLLPPPDHSKSFVIFVNLYPKYTKKHKEKTKEVGVKTFKNYKKIIIVFRVYFFQHSTLNS